MSLVTQRLVDSDCSFIIHWRGVPADCRCLVKWLVQNCLYVHVSKLVPWCDDTSELVSWYVVPQMLTSGKLACTSVGPRCACLLASKLKHFLAKKIFGNSFIYVMSRLWYIIWLIFLFMSAGIINWLRIGHDCQCFLIILVYGVERFNYFDLTDISLFLYVELFRRMIFSLR